MQESYAGGMQVAQSDLYLQIDGIITVQTFKSNVEISW